MGASAHHYLTKTKSNSQALNGILLALYTILKFLKGSGGTNRGLLRAWPV